MTKQMQFVIRVIATLAILAGALGNFAAGTAADSIIDGPTAALIEKAAEEGPLPVIVRLTSVAAQEAVLDDIAGLDASVNVQYDLFPLLALSAGPDALTALAQSGLVVSINEDIPQPPALAAALPLINGDDVQNLGWDGSGQTVAILDTGIDVDHPFFAGRIVSQACYSNSAGNPGESSLCPNGMTVQETGNAADAETANCWDGTDNLCDHGSHVAGIAAGATSGAAGEPGNGVAPGADIIAIQVFTRVTDTDDCDGAPPCVLTYTADQILGLQRVLALNATFTIAAANMSLGGGEFNSNCDVAEATSKVAIDALLAAGIATVVSAGNESFDAATGAPGCISTAITVGSTNTDDSVSSFSNRGTMLDIFAPGCRIGVSGEFGMTSAVPDDTFGFKCGTSMAAPMVTGAFAVLREAYPNATVATLLQYMRDTGVDITYASGGGNVTTPRLDLLAALQEGNTGPSLTVTNASVTVNEGQTATNTGTFSDPEGNPVTLTTSVGAVVDTGGSNWSWSFATTDGPTQSQTVTITATDDKGETGSVTYPLTVNNVAPQVTANPATIDENGTATITGTISDPSPVDTFTLTVDWKDGTGPEVFAYPAGATAFSVQRQFLDDNPTGTPSDTSTLDLTLADDDGGSNSTTASLTVNNVNPVVTLEVRDASQNVIPPGGLVLRGLPVTAGETYSDVGTLDTHTAVRNWGDGTVDQLGAVTGTSSGSHTYTQAGTYTLTTTVTDDDTGTGNAAQQIVVLTPVDALATVIADLRLQARQHPQAATALNAALALLDGSGNGRSPNGAIDLLADGSANLALSKIVQAMIFLNAAEAADPTLDLSATKAMLAMIGGSMVVDAIANAQRVAEADRKISSLERTYLNNANAAKTAGDQRLANGDYNGALGQYLAAMSATMVITK